MDCGWQTITSPSIITGVGPSRSNSTRGAAVRQMSGCDMWVPEKIRGKVLTNSQRPTAPTRVISINPVRDIGLGGDHELSSGKAAVGEGQVGAGLAFGLASLLQPEGKGGMAQPHPAPQDGHQIAQLSPALVAAVGEVAGVRREADTEQVDVVHRACLVGQAHHVARA